MSIRFLKPLIDSTTPRWLILLTDVAIAVLSYVTVQASGAFGSVDVSYDLLRNALVIAGVFLIMSVIVKNYAYIIRLSALNDLYRLFVMCAGSALTLAIINLVCAAVSKAPLMSMWAIAFAVLMAFCLMMIERLAVKYIYLHISSIATERRKRVLVLGTSARSVIVANTLRNELQGSYNPVALLSSKRPELLPERKNNFHVYAFSADSFASLVEELAVEAIIVRPESLNTMSDEMSSTILQTGLKVLTFNHIEENDLDDTQQEQDDNNMISRAVKDVQIEDLLGRDPITMDNTLVRHNVSGQTIMITGACGSIGSEIVRQVAAYKAALIVCVDQAETPMHNLQLEMEKRFPAIKIVTFVGSVQNVARMELAFATYHPRIVLHAAAYKHVPMMEINPTEAIITNVYGTSVVADLAVKYGVDKFVMISTDKAVNPTNVMGTTKRIAEIYTQSLFFKQSGDGHKTQFITTRFGNVLGSNGSVIPLFRQQIREGGPVTVTHKDIIRYFMTIPEACSLVLEASCIGEGGKVYIFDMGRPVKIYDLAVKMIVLSGLRLHKDIEIEETGLRPGEKLYEELLNNKENTTATVSDKIMIAKVKRYDYETVHKEIASIVSLARDNNVHDMIMAMKRLVPEYKSQNSQFEDIDRELESNPQATDNTTK